MVEGGIDEWFSMENYQEQVEGIYKMQKKMNAPTFFYLAEVTEFYKRARHFAFLRTSP